MFRHHKVALVLAVLLLTPFASAAVFDVPSDRALLQRADVIALVTPIEARVEKGTDDQVRTVTTMRVDEILAGATSGSVIEVRERGGILGNRGVRVSGSPTFELGTQTLLFLSRENHGQYHTYGMALGKFDRLEVEGKPYFARTSDGEHLCGITVDGDQHEEQIRSGLFLDWIRETARSGESRIDYSSSLDYESVLSGDQIRFASTHRADYLNTGSGKPLRWTLFDGGGTLQFKANGTQPGGVDGLSGSQAAAAAWNGTQSDVSINVSSSCSVCERQLTDNTENAIILGGASSDVPSSETFLAAAQWYFINSPYTLDGETFYPIDGADIIVSENLSENSSLFSAIMTHEMGHSIGFRHSNSGSPATSDAIMNSSVAAIGATLKTWDRDAAETVYGDGPACRPVSITSQTSSHTIGYQQTASLSITGTSSATNPEYQWYQGSSSDFGQASPISGATSSSYVTPALAAGTYYYWGKTFNECSSDLSDPIVLTVASCQAATIVTEPADAQINAGSSTSLRVVGGGSSPLSYQWYRGESGDTNSPVTGARNPVFNTGVLNASARFWARVTNSCGSADSRTAAINVSGGCDLPVITMQPLSRSVPSGLSAVLRVIATSTNGTISYQWYRVEGDDVVPVGINSDSFSTRAITSDTSYFVEVTDSCGTTTSNTAILTVQNCLLPTVESISGGGQVRYGSRVTLEVDVSGDTPFSYQWYEGNSGDTTKPITGASQSSYTTPELTEISLFWARISNSCGSTSSVTIGIEPVCLEPLTPAIAVSPPSALSGRSYRVSWDDQPGVTEYELQESTTEDFASFDTYAVTGQSREFVKLVTEPTKYYYRVRGTADCNGSIGPFSRSTSVTVVNLPANTATTNVDVAIAEDETEPLVFQIFVPGNGTTQQFTAVSTIEWLTVSPGSGVFPAEGLSFTITANPVLMQVGSNTGSFSLSFGASGKTASDGENSTVSVTVSLVTPVSTATKSAPAETSLFIPAVAHATGFNSQWQSDVRITSIATTPSKLAMNYVPAGAAGFTQAKSTVVNFAPSNPTAFNDVVKNWYGVGSAGDSQIGSLEIRGQGESLAAIASSRTFNVSPNGTFGQFIPAIPFFKFVGATSQGQPAERLSIQQISESAAFRTNVAILEATGQPANVTVSVFNAAGSKIRDIPYAMAPGELKTLNGMLAANGISVEDGRIEIRVDSGSGRVHGYASVVDNRSNDPFLIPGANIDGSTDTSWTLAGVGDFQTGTANWRTDLRIYNAGTSDVNATLIYYPQGGGQSSITTSIRAGEMKVLDNLLRESFQLENSSGLLEITTGSLASLVATARIYDLQDSGTYGQFVPAATADEGFGVDSRPMYVLQLEQSENFRTNLGLAEITGQPANLKISAVVPGTKVAPTLLYNLGPHGFVQLNSVLASMFGSSVTAHNAQISIEVVGGTGRITSYASVVDNRTQDPTYVPGQ